MHSSLAVTEAGLPLGLSAVKFWTRKTFKGANELKRHVNPTRIPIGEKESVRWVDNLVETTALRHGRDAIHFWILFPIRLAEGCQKPCFWLHFVSPFSFCA